MRRLHHLTAAVTGALAIGVVAMSAPATAAGGSAHVMSRVAVAGTVPAWAVAKNATGATAPGQTITIDVGLALRDAAGAERLARSVSDPHGRGYAHYLTPAQFNDRFAPTGAQVATVRAFLTGAGLTVDRPADGNRWLTTTGTVGAFNRAFGTTMRNYRWHGTVLRAPSTPVTVPTSLAGLVVSVGGLDTSGRLRRPMHVMRAPGDTGRATLNRSAKPPAEGKCSEYWGQHRQTTPPAYGKTKFPTYTCGYTGTQLRGAYGVTGMVTKGRDGHGVTVGILDAYGSPTMKADLARYAKLTGEAPLAQYRETLFKPFTMNTECNADGWHVEESLDVEAVHALAPKAKIHYFGAANCDTGIDQALNYIVQHRSADLVSNSYGYQGEDVPPATVKLDESLYLQAAAEGIGLYFSSGDAGDELTLGNTDSVQADFPASSPWVTAVGGTSLAVTKADGYGFETGWGSAHDVIDYSGPTAAYAQPLPGSFLFGAGGGTSRLFAQPPYQAGTVPVGLSRQFGGAAGRVVPDLAAVADPYTGFVIGFTADGQFQVGTIGGTSLACPVVAGIQALASTGRSHRIGFANPLLYSLPSAAFTDVRPTRDPVAVTTPTGSSLTTFDHDSSLATAYGFDNVTGRGTPRGSALVTGEN